MGDLEASLWEHDGLVGLDRLNLSGGQDRRVVEVGFGDQALEIIMVRGARDEQAHHDRGCACPDNHAGRRADARAVDVHRRSVGAGVGHGEVIGRRDAQVGRAVDDDAVTRELRLADAGKVQEPTPTAAADAPHRARDVVGLRAVSA